MILLDSSFLVAYLNSLDENHERAVEIAKRIDEGDYGVPAITDYIFSEVVTVMLLRVRDVSKVASIGDQLLRAVQLIEVSREAFDVAWRIFKEQEKPRFSFTDCTSIAVCKLHGIPKIATFDKDFRRVEGLTVIGL